MSGSGKSFLAREIRAECQRARESVAIYSADDFFMKNGVYAWAEEKLYPAHKSCQAKCRNGMKRGVANILIDNTNMRKKEMIPYVELAHEFGYFVTIR